MSDQDQGRILGQDARFSDENEPTGPDQPISEAEIEDLLYSDALSAEERLQGLLVYRERLTADSRVDFGSGDMVALLNDVDSAIARLRDRDEEAAVGGGLDRDPADHMETLSPDDDAISDLIENDDGTITEDEESDLERDLRHRH